MKSNWFLLLTTLLLLLGITGCTEQTSQQTADDPALEGPALILFYTDN